VLLLNPQSLSLVWLQDKSMLYLTAAGQGQDCIGCRLVDRPREGTSGPYPPYFPDNGKDKTSDSIKSPEVWLTWALPGATDTMATSTAQEPFSKSQLCEV
jgi:hypothetical protein